MPNPGQALGLGGMEKDILISRHNGKQKSKSMKLKTVTLLAAITQILSVFCGMYNSAHLVKKLNWADNSDWFVTTPIHLLGGIMLTVFLFTLAARQKAN